ncbi:MAG: VWA domain-containing protein [Treponema sp.]|jgi:Mg-chelatase subunit ChlD|nr:VWA domain-containing protein [Treponema sp.]
MNLGFLVLFTMMVITPLVPQNSSYFDKTTVIYEIQQVRYVEQKERPEMKAGEASVYITLQQSKEIELDQVPESLLLKALSADVGPKNICFVIDISGSMGYSIPWDTGKIRLDLVKEVCLKMINEGIKENDMVSVISFYHENELVIKHKYIRNAYDRKEVIDAIEKLQPIKDGNTFMGPALEKGYALIKEKDTESYEKWILLFTDGDETQWPVDKSKDFVYGLVEKNRAEEIYTDIGVSTISFFSDEEKNKEKYRNHMNQIAKLGGGSSSFIEDENILSQARLESLIIKKDQINTEWKNAEFDVTLVLSEGVLLSTAYPYNDIQPQIPGNTLIYPHVRLGKSISLNLSLSEDAVYKKATILLLSVTSSDKSFSLLENYPISLNNPVTADGEIGFLTFVIKKYKWGE